MDVLELLDAWTRTGFLLDGQFPGGQILEMLRELLEPQEWLPQHFHQAQEV